MDGASSLLWLAMAGVGVLGLLAALVDGLGRGGRRRRDRK